MTTLAMDKQIEFSLSNGIFPSSAYVQSWNKNLVAQYAVLSTSISSSANNALTFLQSRGVLVDDSVSIENFLTNYYGIVAYLFDAPKKISEYFGDAKLRMGLLVDPDAAEDQPELYLEVETALSPEEANQKLTSLNHEWLLSSKDKDLLAMNVTLKFI